MKSPNKAQPPRHGVVKRTTGGPLARSWPPPLPRRRRCCALLLVLLGPSAAAANNHCGVVASAVCRVLSLSLTLCICTPRALAYVNGHPPRHGVIKWTIGGSLLCSWLPPLPRHHRCCTLLLLLLGLPAAAAAAAASAASASTYCRRRRRCWCCLCCCRLLLLSVVVDF